MRRCCFVAGLAAIMVALAALAARPVRACDIPGFTPHAIDPAEQVVDHVPPVMAQSVRVNIVRGRGPQRSGCGYSGTSCDGLGNVWLRFEATDDRTGPTGMGFRFALVDGALPAGAMLPAQDVRAAPETGIMLWWNERVDDDAPLIAFTLEVRAVDAAGNVSAPIRVPVRDGNDDSGCALVPATHPSALPLAAPLALVALALRRRRSESLSRARQRPAPPGAG